MPRTKPAATPTATELTAIMPTFVCQRFCCIAVSFPDLVNKDSINQETEPPMQRAETCKATFWKLAHWDVPAAGDCRRPCRRQSNPYCTQAHIRSSHADRCRAPAQDRTRSEPPAR